MAGATALICAGPAAAALQDGVYAMDGSDGMSEVTVTTNCLPTGCATLVSSNAGWVAQAQESNGLWYFSYTRPDGQICPDRTFAPVTVHYAVNLNTMSGVMSADSNGDCPGGVINQTPFSFHKVR
ncbi:hypothetical protein [Mycolicibacterium brumae]|uniref:hypothetical protein n=1 Tax=Mycolicibacterium brumae TaxID=85968 RepID=UPI000FE204AD|nr:hypothetical protein [Mycolicibacterium brumae]MCV7194226.1 hypothetical protein [Mycolicibacterium brumae]UWW10413.1 hypothetical protein L2Z93_003542 [Mycolicibacterium brumae]